MTVNIDAPITGSVWRVLVDVGTAVSTGDMVAILESMKLEIPVESEVEGLVAAVLVAEGDTVVEGQPMMSVESS